MKTSGKVIDWRGVTTAKKQRVEQECCAKAGDYGATNHYWVIDIADGETSPGVCRYCGEVKKFWNYLPLDYCQRDLTQSGDDDIKSEVEYAIEVA